MLPRAHWPSLRAVGLALGLAVVLTLALARPAHAVVTITSNADSGAGTLRDALANAVNGETIVVPPMHITLTSAELAVDRDVRIRGAGARHTTIDGGNNVRIFKVTAKDATMSGLRLTRGTGQATAGGGGGSGGAIQIGGYDRLTLTTSAVTSNQTPGYGGAIENSGGTLVVERSTIDHNMATGAGGGISSEQGGSFGGFLVLMDSTVSTNQTGGRGGDVYVNTFMQPDAINLVNDTITGGTAASGGGGLDVENQSHISVSNTIIAGNSATPSTTANCQFAGGTPSSLSAGGNLEDQNQCLFNPPSDQISAVPGLGPLQDNGGPTDTEAIGPTSPAANAGLNGPCPDVDQRGIPRPQQGTCDIGAYEYLPPPGTAITRSKIEAKHHRATFSFKAIGLATGFRCALLRVKPNTPLPRPSFTRCRSPKAYKQLKSGKYLFEVKAFNSTGADRTPAKKSFRI
jgi:hypothetical protein